MSVIKLVSKAMERIAPLKGPPLQHRNSRNVLLTIDLTPQVLKEAIALPAAAIIAYHPPLFKPLSSLTLANPLQASLLWCATAGISIYSPHTALDSVYGGINDWLADGLGEGKVELLHGETVPSLGGGGRLVCLDEKVSFKVLQERVKKYLGLTHLQVAQAPTRLHNDVQTIAICAGSGGSVLQGIKADVYLTGEMSHHEVLAAVAADRSVILCGHSNTERGYLPILANRLREEFSKLDGEGWALAKEISFHVSDKDADPLITV
ncbi:hypothetical protein HETIRDRAFT_413128 [Heterobasidion irregulare TC 32-1]|uniref:NGG1p interacting factor 3 n=1 Tax=Heterobasidion irregulare (strain TC 32-1) TaxID=747525 RepID=W4KLP7_HETIT|nr:uncharacterized protein HETIRDRAFT_413128 [Heterobasidion irregulare TC 32-1]ETW86752.1 hypothetical protein HETIRDRAFT_413128 [Heterobasidion irregulare TC 32-1]